MGVRYEGHLGGVLEEGKEGTGRREMEEVCGPRPAGSWEEAEI